MNWKQTLNKPKIIAYCGDVNTGKSMGLYHLITTLRKDTTFKLYSYGLRCSLGEQKIYSVEELEKIKDSIIIVDEFFSLFDLDNRKKKRLIENTLRLINHNNNILILTGLPENFKKFVSAKLDMVIFKKCALADFVNGSRLKNICMSYKGTELGSTLLNIPINEALVYDGNHFSRFSIPYYPEFDSKKDNVKILKCAKKIEKVKVAPLISDLMRSNNCARNVET